MALCLGLAATPAIASEASSPALRATVADAVETLLEGASLLDAYRLLRAVPPESLPGQPADLRRDFWWALGWATYELGRYDETREAGRRLLELAAESGDAIAEARGLYYLASSDLADRRRHRPREAAIRRLGEIVELAQRQRLPHHEFRARLALGKLLPGEHGERELRAALALAERLGSARDRSDALLETARFVARRDPRAGMDALHRALEAASAADDPWGIYGWQARLEVLWAALPRAAAIAATLPILEQIEAHRRAQDESETGAMGFFSIWVDAYRRAVGYLLDGDEPSATELTLAFELSEHMRARVLLESLEHAGGLAGAPSAGRPAAAKRLAIRQRIVARQRQLRRAGSLRERAPDRELENLLLEEEALARRGRRPPSGAAPEVEFATLAEVRDQLAPTEALLVFQLGSWRDHYGAFAGGSWLFALTRDDTVVHRLPDRLAVELRLDLFQASLRRRDGSERQVAAALYRDLLSEALRGLDGAVERLILVPESALHALPFAALAATPSSPPLAERYELVYAPSATLWRRGKTAPPPRLRPAALALADPLSPPPPDGLSSGGLPALRHARREAQQLRRRFGPSARLVTRTRASEQFLKSIDLEPFGLVLFAAHALLYEEAPRRSAVVLASGGDAEDGLLQPPEIVELDFAGKVVVLSTRTRASEQFLKSIDLEPFGLVLFAAHALLYEEAPRRSAVVLASGGDAEDGLLQPPEIVELDFAGKVVVLSACRSASGQEVAGEGLLSLARSFFEAGAETVVGNLWPVRDAEAAALFGAVYRHLGRGESVAGAVRQAQLDRQRAGAPPEAWAGVVVLGNGERVPLPRPPSDAPGRSIAAAALALLVLATAAVAWRRRYE